MVGSGLPGSYINVSRSVFSASITASALAAFSFKGCQLTGSVYNFTTFEFSGNSFARGSANFSRFSATSTPEGNAYLLYFIATEKIENVRFITVKNNSMSVNALSTTPAASTTRIAALHFPNLFLVGDVWIEGLSMNGLQVKGSFFVIIGVWFRAVQARSVVVRGIDARDMSLAVTNSEGGRLMLVYGRELVVVRSGAILFDNVWIGGKMSHVAPSNIFGARAVSFSGVVESSGGLSVSNSYIDLEMQTTGLFARADVVVFEEELNGSLTVTSSYVAGTYVASGTEMSVSAMIVRFFSPATHVRQITVRDCFIDCSANATANITASILITADFLVAIAATLSNNFVRGRFTITPTSYFSRVCASQAWIVAPTNFTTTSGVVVNENFRSDVQIEGGREWQAAGSDATSLNVVCGPRTTTSTTTISTTILSTTMTTSTEMLTSTMTTLPDVSATSAAESTNESSSSSTIAILPSNATTTTAPTTSTHLNATNITTSSPWAPSP